VDDAWRVESKRIGRESGPRSERRPLEASLFRGLVLLCARLNGQSPFLRDK
jgi:hypothetical protein